MTGTSTSLNIKTLAIKSEKELRSLVITLVEWNNANAIKFTLSDGQSFQAGKGNFTKSHTFDPTKKITRIEVVFGCYLFSHDEWLILHINFYHHQKRLVAVGYNEEDRELGGRREFFDIADDEQLFGCEIDYNLEFYLGVTWLKLKISE